MSVHPSLVAGDRLAALEARLAAAEAEIRELRTPTGSWTRSAQPAPRIVCRVCHTGVEALFVAGFVCTASNCPFGTAVMASGEGRD